MMLGPELQEPDGSLFKLTEVLSLGGMERMRGLLG